VAGRQRRYASLVAMDSTRVLGLEREKLESMLAADPLLVYRVMRAIVRAVHQIQRQLYMQQNELTNYIYKQHGRTEPGAGLFDRLQRLLRAPQSSICPTAARGRPAAGTCA